MINFIVHKKWLLVIIVIGFFLRFYDLSHVPPSPSLDEVSIGYNAYSILKTGADEYGTKLPILLRAYDDWRPALYVYLVIPFVAIFDLNVFAVRLPSVLLSVLTVLTTYFLAKQVLVLSLKSQAFKTLNSDLIALLAAGLLAISPWHIYISRLGHETNAGLAFMIIGFFFFLYALNDIKKGWFLLISTIFIGLSFYTYQSEKIFLPLMLIMLLVLYRRDLWAIKKIVGISVVFGLVIILPILNASLSPQALIRYEATSAFANNSLYQESANKLLFAKQKGNFIEEVYSNRRITTLRIFLGNFISHFNPLFLFGNTGNEPFKAPDMGLLYPWELFLIVTGGLTLIIKKIDFRVKILFLGWILIAFIPPSFTTQAPHAMRSYNLLPIPQVLGGLGFLGIYEVFKKKVRIKLTLLLITIAAISFSILTFYKQYFFEFPKNQSLSFQYALSKAIPFVLKKESLYDSIIFSNKDNLYQSYMFYLFFSKYDPFLYQKQGGTVSGGFAENHKFGKFLFRPILWSKEQKVGSILYIGNVFDFPEDVSFLYNAKYINGDIGVKIVESNNK